MHNFSLSTNTELEVHCTAFSVDVAATSAITSLSRYESPTHKNSIVLFLLAGTGTFYDPTTQCRWIFLFFSDKCKQSKLLFCVHFFCFFVSSANFLLSIKATILPLSSITSQITISLPNGRTNDRTRGALQLSFLSLRVRVMCVYCAMLEREPLYVLLSIISSVLLLLAG